MNRLQRYLLRSLLVATLYSTAGLTLTIWLSQSLKLIELVVESGAPLRFFLWLLLLTVPTFLGVVLPIALVAAILFTYNKLTMDSELVVMRAAGVGPAALALPAATLGLLVMTMVYALNLYITPAAHQELVRMEYAVRKDYSQLFLREGVFNEVGDRMSVYLKERDFDGYLKGVLIHDTRKPETPVTIMGERAVMVTSDAGARLLVYNGNRQELDRTTGRLSQLYFDQHGVDLKVLTESGAQRFPDARERSTEELLNPPPDAAQDDKQLRQLFAELHHRFSSPLLALTFTVTALACLLSGEFNRRGQASRLTMAVFLVVGLQALSLGVTSLASKASVFVPAMYAVPLLTIIPGLLVLVRTVVIRRRRAVA